MKPEEEEMAKELYADFRAAIKKADKLPVLVIVGALAATNHYVMQEGLEAI